MKITVIGGGGVRAPLFAHLAARDAGRFGLTEVCLHDVRPRHLGVFGALAKAVAARANPALTVTTTTDIEAAVAGAGAVILSIRQGFDESRAFDERLVADAGYIAQETTGPAGFAMALRTIPAAVDYARAVQRFAPDAWLINFTNPAGLITQALVEAGFTKVVGICDSAEGGRQAAAAALGVSRREIDPMVFGLNHLSVTLSLRRDGRALLPALLDDPAFVAAHQAVFEPDVPALYGAFLNEYLYYFLHRRHALTAQAAKRELRGEQVHRLNRAIFAELEPYTAAGRIDEALHRYEAYLAERHGTYMEAARGARRDMGGFEEEADSYASIALNLVRALRGGEPVRMTLNVPNAVPGAARPTPAHHQFLTDDVVEISCTVAGGAVVPDVIDNPAYETAGRGPTPPGGPRISPRAVPADLLELMRAVKVYERWTASAVASRDADLAARALAAHPLVGDITEARRLVRVFTERYGFSGGAFDPAAFD